MLSVGQGDPIVTFPLTLKTGEILRGILGENLTFNEAPRNNHPPSQQEMNFVATFMGSQLGL